jgi:hypothetical protein
MVPILRTVAFMHMPNPVPCRLTGGAVNPELSELRTRFDAEFGDWWNTHIIPTLGLADVPRDGKIAAMLRAIALAAWAAGAEHGSRTTGEIVRKVMSQ